MEIANKDESEGRVATDASLILFSDFVNKKFQTSLSRVKWYRQGAPIRVANESLES